MKTKIFIKCLLIVFICGCSTEEKNNDYPAEKEVYFFLNEFINDKLKLSDSVRYIFYEYFDEQYENELLKFFENKKSLKIVFSDYNEIALENQINNFKIQLNNSKDKRIKIKQSKIKNNYKKFSKVISNDTIPITVLSYPLISMHKKYIIMEAYSISKGNRKGKITVYERESNNQLLVIADKILDY